MKNVGEDIASTPLSITVILADRIVYALHPIQTNSHCLLTIVINKLVQFDLGDLPVFTANEPQELFVGSYSLSVAPKSE